MLDKNASSVFAANYPAPRGMLALRFSKNSLNTPQWRQKNMSEKPKKTVPSIRRWPSHNNDP